MYGAVTQLLGEDIVISDPVSDSESIDLFGSRDPSWSSGVSISGSISEPSRIHCARATIISI
jgi:hypothetical protein